MLSACCVMKLTYAPQVLLRAIVGEARLCWGELPPSCEFMRRVQRAVSEKENGNWQELSAHAQQCLGSFEEVPYEDATGLPQWWEDYPRDYCGSSAAQDLTLVKAWDACSHILRHSGQELGTPVRFRLLWQVALSKTPQEVRRPGGNLAEFMASIHAIQERLYLLHDDQLQDAVSLARLEIRLGNDLVSNVQNMDAEVQGWAEARVRLRGAGDNTSMDTGGFAGADEAV